MALGHHNVQSRGIEMLGVGTEGCGELGTNSAGRNGLPGFLHDLSLGCQLRDEAAGTMVKRAQERFGEHVSFQSQFKGFVMGGFLGVDKLVGEGNQFSRGGNGGRVFIRERPDSGVDRRDNLVKDTTILRCPRESSGRPKAHAGSDDY